MITSPRDLLNGYLEISSLPLVYEKLNDAVNNPRASMSDIARVISEDAGLTARLLRIVNSAFYGFPSRVDSISRAVTILGTHELRALALATSVTTMFKGIPVDLVSMDSFWRHSIACGVTARILATYRRVQNAERFFIAGVLHDIGRLVMYMKIPDQSRQAIVRSQEMQEPLFVSEREVIGFGHASVGSLLLEAWSFPAGLEEAVGFHHNPNAASRYPLEAAIIHLADIIVHAMELGSSGEQSVPPLDPEAWDRVGLPVSVLSPTVVQLENQFEDVVNMMVTGDKS
jgi:HD-like signal output (HDOD) protein